MTPYDMIKAHFSKAVPFANHTGVVIEELAAGTARATLVLRPEVSNHIGTMHAGAVFTLAEAASGAAMAGAFADVLLELRPVAAEATIAFLKVSQGDLVADAHIVGVPAEVRAEMDAAGKVSFPVEVTITDASGVTVSKVAVAWHVSRKR
jgi:uncharacterized protein (TIGR00369 family)